MDQLWRFLDDPDQFLPRSRRLLFGNCLLTRKHLPSVAKHRIAPTTSQEWAEYTSSCSPKYETPDHTEYGCVATDCYVVRTSRYTFDDGVHV